MGVFVFIVFLLKMGLRFPVSLFILSLLLLFVFSPPVSQDRFHRAVSSSQQLPDIYTVWMGGKEGKRGEEGGFEGGREGGRE